MSTCAELFAELTVLNAESVVLAAEQTLLSSEITANNMNIWYTTYNLMLQGCGSPMATSTPVEPESVAETRAREKLWEHLKGKADQTVEDARTALGDAEKALDEQRAARDTLKAS